MLLFPFRLNTGHVTNDKLFGENVRILELVVVYNLPVRHPRLSYIDDFVVDAAHEAMFDLKQTGYLVEKIFINMESLLFFL